jgi:predicted hotdog family 3-hydroxylacyl-ACP dehydratase
MQKNRVAVTSGDDILRYIPQRPPVVMVDAFYGLDGECSYSGYTVPGESIFCRGGILDECALIENMAQSAALRVGWLCVSEGKDVPLGFIGSVGKCDIARRARAGETLLTSVKVVAEIGNVTLAEAEITSGSERIGSCTLKIFLQQ